MGFRQYDFQCARCTETHPDLVWVPHGQKPPKRARIFCRTCGDNTMHDRLISAPAKYTYDRPFAPVVYGGKYDTMGHRQSGVELPDLPRDATFDQARDVLMSKDRREKVEANLAVARENKLKRKRAAAMKKDPNLNLRAHRLPGDPEMRPLKG